MEPFGVNYDIRQGLQPKVTDVVGQAYRATGARIFQQPFKAWTFSPSALTANDLQALRNLSAALKNGTMPRETTETMKALTPLWAFRDTLLRQAKCKGAADEAQAWFFEAKATLCEELEKLLP